MDEGGEILDLDKTAVRYVVNRASPQIDGLRFLQALPRELELLALEKEMIALRKIVQQNLKISFIAHFLAASFHEPIA